MVKIQEKYLEEIQEKCLNNIKESDFKSFDLYDALTNPFLNRISRGNVLLRRILIQINAKCPFDLHWLGMRKMVHTKTISDLLWFFSIHEHSESHVNDINHFFSILIGLKSKKGYGWGLNFPFTSRFIDADENMPNLYNTINSGIAICYSFPYLKEDNILKAQKALKGILEFIDKELGFIDEGEKGWISYYPAQTSPTYNVNALALYFLVFFKKIDQLDNDGEVKIKKILTLLIKEQESDGSWFYSRSNKGKWIDGFHSAFILESLAYTYCNGYNGNKDLKDCLEKGWIFYIDKMFTKDNFPRYFLNSGRYPIESQNIAQAIQTLSIFRQWLGYNVEEKLNDCVIYAINFLYDKRGFFYQKKAKWFFNKTPYFRWSVTPMVLALEYAKKALNTEQ